MLRRLPAAAAAAAAAARAQHTSALRDAFRECQAIVQKHDGENFLWAGALPAQTRAPVMMLRALHAETSLIGEHVTAGGPPLREMRFRWWSDSVDAVYSGRDVEHPVLAALKFTLDVAPLPQYRLKKLIAAKAADQVAHAPFANVAALEAYAEATQSNLHYLHLAAAGIDSADADHAASHLGKAVGLAGLLRGSVHFLQRGVSYLPVDACARHGVAAEALFRGEGLDSDGVRAVVFAVASAANGHLAASEELHGRPEAVPRAARRLFLAGVACKLYLQALERCNFNIADPRLAGGGFSPLWHVLQLKYAQAVLR